MKKGTFHLGQPPTNKMQTHETHTSTHRPQHQNRGKMKCRHISKETWAIPASRSPCECDTKSQDVGSNGDDDDDEYIFTVIVVVVVGGCGGSGSAAVRNKEPKIILKKGNNHKEDAGCHGTTRTDGVVRAASSVTFNALSFCHPRPNNENVFEQTARFTMARHDVISNAAETPCTTTNTKAASHTLPGNGNELDRGFKTCDCVSKQFLGRGGDWLKTWGRCVNAENLCFFLFCAKPD